MGVSGATPKNPPRQQKLLWTISVPTIQASCPTDHKTEDDTKVFLDRMSSLKGSLISTGTPNILNFILKKKCVL